MSDLISRQAVENITWEEPSYSDPLNVLTEVREKVRALPSVENKGEWIPVEKCGYPKPEDEYKHFLTIDNKGEITIQEFLLSLDEEPQPYFTGMRNIVAWQPLPEVYKAERGE